MKLNLISFFLLLLSSYGFASGDWAAHSGRSAGMGYTSAADIDLWSAHNNQAGLAFYEKTSAGIYIENRFLIKELATQSGAFTFKTKSGVFGATIDYSGDANYNTTMAGLAYGLKIGKRFAAGIRLDYIRTSIGEDYGNRSNLTFDLGILVKVTNQLTFGVHTFNPLHVKISEYNNERIPTILNTGLSYSFSEKLLLTVEANKNSERPMELLTGAEYKLNKIAYARIGLTTNPARYTFGIGLERKNLKLDISSTIHLQLGYSPQLSFQYTFQ